MKPIVRRCLAVLAAVCFTALTGTAARAAPTYEVVASFELGPKNPDAGRLLRHTDGFLYGTTPSAGANGLGCVYRVSPAGVFSVFAQCTEATGSNPYAGLISDGADGFYGVASGGGNFNAGTVFRVSAGGVISVVVHFTGAGGAAPGSLPLGELIRDAQGNIFGTAQGGGPADAGTVFKITPGGLYSTVVQFTGTGGAFPGSGPYAGLTPDGSGGYYGTTSLGGAGDAGTVFRITSGGAFSSVSSFTGTAGLRKGRLPFGPLVRDPVSGLFYGTTFQGGATDDGTVFSVSPAGEFATLVEFTGAGGDRPGSRPFAGLAADEQGGYYGVCSRGGTFGAGTAYKITDAGVFTLLTTFTNLTNTTGVYPIATLLRDAEGGFYGTTAGVGSDMGTVFLLSPAGVLTTVTRFNGNGSPDLGRNPYGGVIADAAENFYGTTYGGGTGGLGTVYKIPDGGAPATLASFTGTTGAVRGARPHSGLLRDASGNLYGTANAGGVTDAGTIFKITPQGAYSTLLEFRGAAASGRGARPIAGLTRAADNRLYGVASGGGTDLGNIFSIAETGVFRNQLNFSGNAGAAPGSQPYAPLFLDSEGELYGSTRIGGFSGQGSLFRLAKDGTYSLLASFTGVSGQVPGSQPHGILAEDGTGNYFGTTRAGGAANQGTVFRVTREGVLTSLLAFTGSAGAFPGSQPYAGLTADGAGNYYGTTFAGGAGNLGTVFRVNAAGQFASVLQFTGNGGAVPGANPSYATLLRHTDGNLYGTAQAGGPGGAGVVYRVRFGPAPRTLPADQVTQTSAVLHGLMNPNGEATEVSFEWGLSPQFGHTTPVQNLAAGNSSAAFSAALSGLKSGSTHYFRIKGVNATGTQYGRTLTFTTALASTQVLCVFAGPDPLSPLLEHNQVASFSMGTTFPGFPSVRTITLVNGGVLPLAVSGLTLPAGLVLDSPAPPLSLTPGSMVTWVLRQTAAAPGTLTGNVVIASDDPVTPSFQFPVSGSVLAGSPFGDGLIKVVPTGINEIGIEFSAVSGLRYFIEASPDLTAWTVLRSSVGTAAGIVPFSESVEGSRRFYRLRFNP